MPILNFGAGNPPPTAQDFNTNLIQQAHAVKTSDTSRSSLTSLTNDPHLFLTVSANTIYLLEAFIWYTGPTTADLKIGFTGPSGTSLDWCLDGLGPGETNQVGLVVRTKEALGGSGATACITGSDNVVVPKGVLKTGSSSGILRFVWSQNTSNATSCTVYAKSVLMLRRMV